MRAVYSRKCLITSSLELCRRALMRHCVLWATQVTPCKPWETATPTCGRDLHAMWKGFLQGSTWSPVHPLVTSWVRNYPHEVHLQDNCCRQYSSKNWGLCPLAIYKYTELHRIAGILLWCKSLCFSWTWWVNAKIKLEQKPLCRYLRLWNEPRVNLCLLLALLRNEQLTRFKWI